MAASRHRLKFREDWKKLVHELSEFTKRLRMLTCQYRAGSRERYERAIVKTAGAGSAFVPALALEERGLFRTYLVTYSNRHGHQVSCNTTFLSVLSFRLCASGLACHHARRGHGRRV